MKHTICGFSQEFALTLRKTVERKGKQVEIRMDCTDLAILRWFVDFYPFMNKMTVEGKEYVFLSHGYLIEQMPILGISKDGVISRMQKLVEFGVLEYKLLKKNGNMPLYAFGAKYESLVHQTPYEVEPVPSVVEPVTLTGSNREPLPDQTRNKNSSIIDSSIKDSYIPPICPPVKVVRHYYGEYRNVLLSDPELEKLQNEFPDDWQERIERLSSYMASTGKRYTNFLATIRNWARKDKEREKKSGDGWDYIQAVAEGRAE